jgi:hypothetical protein
LVKIQEVKKKATVYYRYLAEESGFSESEDTNSSFIRSFNWGFEPGKVVRLEMS